MVYQASSKFGLLVLFLMVVFAEACDIEIRLKSETRQPFQFHFSVESARYWSDRVTVTERSIQLQNGSFTNLHTFHVKGVQCNKQDSHFFVWGLERGSTLSSPKWKVTDHAKFKLESLSFEPFAQFFIQPYIFVTVKNDLKMWFGPAFGVYTCIKCHNTIYQLRG